MNFSGKSNWRNTLSSLLIQTALSACAHVSTPPVVNSYCSIAKPIRYNSKLDSPATVEQIEAHNSAWVCVCEEDCPNSGKEK